MGSWGKKIFHDLQNLPLWPGQFQQLPQYLLLEITTPKCMLKCKPHFGKKPDLPWPALNILVWKRWSAWPSSKGRPWRRKEDHYYFLREDQSSTVALTSEDRLRTHWELSRDRQGMTEGALTRRVWGQGWAWRNTSHKKLMLYSLHWHKDCFQLKAIKKQQTQKELSALPPICLKVEYQFSFVKVFSLSSPLPGSGKATIITRGVKSALRWVYTNKPYKNHLYRLLLSL